MRRVSAVSVEEPLGLVNLFGTFRIVTECVYDLLKQRMTPDGSHHSLRHVRGWVIDLFLEFSGLLKHRIRLLDVRECLTPGFGEFVVDQFELPA